MRSLFTVSLLLTAAAWRASANVVVPDPTATANTSSPATIADGTAVTAAEAPPPPSFPPTITVYNSSGGNANDTRDSRFLSFSMGSADSASAAATNILQEKQDETATDPSAHLVDIYTDCLMQLSFPCVQRKLLLFLDKLGRMKGKRPTTTSPNVF